MTEQQEPSHPTSSVPQLLTEETGLTEREKAVSVRLWRAVRTSGGNPSEEALAVGREVSELSGNPGLGAPQVLSLARLAEEDASVRHFFEVMDVAAASEHIDRRKEAVDATRLIRTALDDRRPGESLDTVVQRLGPHSVGEQTRLGVQKVLDHASSNTGVMALLTFAAPLPRQPQKSPHSF